jgi:adenylate kinase
MWRRPDHTAIGESPAAGVPGDCPDVILVGPPGAGKSTLAARLAERLGFVRLSPGEILRQVADQGSPIGRRVRDVIAEGALVSDDVVEEVVRRRLEAIPQEQHVILDGYPRTAAQAESLRRLFAESGRLRRRPVVLRLDVSPAAVLERLRRRRDIEGRSDDRDDAIGRRLQTYDAEVAQVVDPLARWSDVR